MLQFAAQAILLVVPAGSPAAPASGQAVLGRVLRDAPCPVMVVPSDRSSLAADGRRGGADHRMPGTSGDAVELPPFLGQAANGGVDVGTAGGR